MHLNVLYDFSLNDENHRKQRNVICIVWLWGTVFYFLGKYRELEKGSRGLLNWAVVHFKNLHWCFKLLEKSKEGGHLFFPKGSLLSNADPSPSTPSKLELSLCLVFFVEAMLTASPFCLSARPLAAWCPSRCLAQLRAWPGCAVPGAGRSGCLPLGR